MSESETTRNLTPTAEGLTTKQLAFCDEYIVDFNATAASQRAGYKDGAYGRALMMRDDITAHVAHVVAEQSVRTGITADRVREELALVAFAELEEIIKTHDKISALRELGKHLGIAQHIEHSGAIAIGDMSDEEIDEALDRHANRVSAHVNGGPSRNGDG